MSLAHLSHSNILELSILLSTHLHCLVAHLRVRLSEFKCIAWELASSGTCSSCGCDCLLLLRVSRHARRLGAAEDRREKLGDCASSPIEEIVRGLEAFPAGGTRKPTLVESVACGSPSCEWFLRVPTVGWQPLPLLANHQVGASPQRGRSLPGSKWTSEKNHRVICACSLEISLLTYPGDWFIPYSSRWYKAHNLSLVLLY